MPGCIITRSLRKGVPCLWPWAAPGSQSSCFYSHKWVFQFPPLPLPTLFSSLQWKDARTHTVNKQEKVSRCWVIADVSNPYWETFNFQLCLAFLLSNHFCDKWSFHSWEAAERNPTLVSFPNNNGSIFRAQPLDPLGINLKIPVLLQHRQLRFLQPLLFVFCRQPRPTWRRPSPRWRAHPTRRRRQRCRSA